MADLLGLRVIVTRPLAQAEVWSEQLQAAGADTCLIPLLRLRAVTDEAQIQAIKNTVLDFDLYQKAIFVSQNAVDFALQWLEDYWPQLPMGVEYFAVGETTARHLQECGIKVSALTAVASGAMNSESLLQAPELQAVAGEKIVIFRGCGGRGHMGELLQARGAQVSYCELYERLLPELACEQFFAAFAHSGDWQAPTVIALHSGESLQNYLLVLEELTRLPDMLESVAKMRALPLLVPGQRVAQLATDAGFKQIIIAENATDQSMLDALLEQQASKPESR